MGTVPEASTADFIRGQLLCIGSKNVPVSTASRVREAGHARGFTLLELVVVLAVLAGLAAIAVPAYQGFVTRTQATTALSEASSMRVAAESEVFGVSTIPDELSDGLALEIPGDDTATITVQRPRGRIVLTRSGKGQWACAHSFDTALPDCGVLEAYHTIASSDGLNFDANYRGSSVEQGGNGYSGPDRIQIPSSFGGNSITDIQQDAFKNSGIKEVVFSDDSQVKQIHARSFRYNELQEITLPDSLETLDWGAFRNNPNLDRVTIGDSVNVTNQPFSEAGFRDAYDSGGAGTYVLDDDGWKREE